MIKKGVFVVLSICLLGCQEVVRPEKPDNLIPQETMVQLLTEVYLGNSARSIDNKRIREQGIKLDSFLFAKYSVDSIQFAKSNAYYAADLDTYNAIFDKIQEQLEQELQEENAKKLEKNAKKRAKKDSLKNKATEVKEETVQPDGAIIDPAVDQ